MDTVTGITRINGYTPTATVISTDLPTYLPICLHTDLYFPREYITTSEVQVDGEDGEIGMR